MSLWVRRCVKEKLGNIVVCPSAVNLCGNHTAGVEIEFRQNQTVLVIQRLVIV